MKQDFSIDAGFIHYYRPESGKRFRTSWGFSTPEHTLSDALRSSMDFLPDFQAPSGRWVDSHQAPPVWREILDKDGISRVGVWLITVEETPVGIMVLGGRAPGPADDAELITMCMMHISVVLEMLILRRRAEEVSVRDPLTGLLNRRGFLEAFNHVTHTQLPNRYVVLAVLDVDGFKRINDEFGHLAGDGALQKVARAVKRPKLLTQAYSARFGGDEFVLLGRSRSSNVDELSRNLQSWFRSKTGLSVSVGCAIYGTDGEDFATCFSVADHRLYTQKRAPIA